MPDLYVRAAVRSLWLSVLSTFLGIALASVALAGGGPENVLLVVNPESPASLTIANHYARLRQVPPSNVFYLPWDPKSETTDGDTFRQRILKPVIEAARLHYAPGQIDYVVYSADFPWAIRLQAKAPTFEAAAGNAAPSGKVPGKPKPLTHVGSLTGLTYLWQPVMMDLPAYRNLQNNQYMRREVPQQKDAPSRGFKSTHIFGRQGELVEANGASYLLSMMLGVTAGRGNTVPEVLDYLTRSAAADGTRPRGTIYYAQNGDIRSRARQNDFPAAVGQLKALGVNAEIVQGVLPMGKKDVQGAMIGAANFNWKSSGSTIRPGAICEHFTSYGGIMSANAGQTPLSELLRYGAAGASGTVTEPYAIGDKFPHPRIHVHYARGCTLAEAFYQSVFGPYQLLIVGDPLCRPWANIPRVTLAGLPASGSVQGKVTLNPAATIARGEIDRFEFFVDGRHMHDCRPGKSLELDTARLADGYHELRVVAIEAGPIASQGRHIVPLITSNHGRTIQVDFAGRAVRDGQPLALAVKSPGSIGVSVLQGTRLVGRLPGAEGRIEIKPGELGSGPVRLQIIGLGNGGPRTHVAAPPIEVEVEKKG